MYMENIGTEHPAENGFQDCKVCKHVIPGGVFLHILGIKEPSSDLWDIFPEAKTFKYISSFHVLQYSAIKSAENMNVCGFYFPLI